MHGDTIDNHIKNAFQLCFGFKRLKLIRLYLTRKIRFLWPSESLSVICYSLFLSTTMKAILSILIVAAILAAAFYIYDKNASREQTPVDAIEVAEESVEPAPLEVAVPEEVSPAVIPESVPPQEDEFAKRAAEPFTALTDTQGRVIQAKVLSVTDEEIKLRRSDGLETTIPISMLSEADAAFCEYLRDNPPKANNTATSIIVSPDTSASPDALDAEGGIDWDAIFGKEM